MCLRPVTIFIFQFNLVQAEDASVSYVFQLGLSVYTLLWFQYLADIEDGYVPPEIEAYPQLTSWNFLCYMLSFGPCCLSISLMPNHMIFRFVWTFCLLTSYLSPTHLKADNKLSHSLEMSQILSHLRVVIWLFTLSTTLSPRLHISSFFGPLHSL